MTIYDSIILGIVESITEFLPVSSTAHLVFASELLNVE
jgi:undecaprenyl-diphosphatase